jgi:hypothetical protein
MKRLRSYFVLGIFAMALGTFRSPAATTNQPGFEEVFQLLRANLAGTTEKELDGAAVQGLISKLYPRVALITNGTPKSTEQKLVSKTSLFDGPIGYVRIARVESNLADKIRDAHKELNTTNKLKGVVLDLRFADGNDYNDAAEVADLFTADEVPLLDFGKGMIRSKRKTDAWKLPVAVLVNHRTASAAEALAAVLRENGAALIIGTNTAGQAAITKEFDLKTGQRLRIATSLIKLADGKTLPLSGVKPDIQISVSEADEKTYLGDPFADLRPMDFALSTVSTNTTSTNRLRRRISEADLVRARREGANIDELPEREEPEKPEVRDPALARALDVLKGLAVVKQFRP